MLFQSKIDFRTKTFLFDRFFSYVWVCVLFVVCLCSTKKFQNSNKFGATCTLQFEEVSDWTGRNTNSKENKQTLYLCVDCFDWLVVHCFRSRVDSLEFLLLVCSSHSICFLSLLLHTALFSSSLLRFLVIALSQAFVYMCQAHTIQIDALTRPIFTMKSFSLPTKPLN